MTTRFLTAFIAVLLLAASGAADVEPTGGYGETDYEFASRRECCEAALAAAQAEGATKCRARGGDPIIDRSVRGSCTTRTGRDGHARPIHACRSEVEVGCR